MFASGVVPGTTNLVPRPIAVCYHLANRNTIILKVSYRLNIYVQHSKCFWFRLLVTFSLCV